MDNESEFSEFVLVGFPGLPQRFHIGVGILIFLVYNVSLCANITVIMLIFLKEHLHKPMYIVIASLAISDLLFDTSTLSKIIAKYWFGAGSMTFMGCFLQMTIVHTLNPLDSLIIMLMAVDRIILTKACSTARSESWNKAFYTCVTHWFVIGTYNVPRLLVYTYEQTKKPQVDIYVSLICLYTFVPHFMSPIIFCLRTEEIKKTLRSIFKRRNNS
ncbi:unnamed protein product [Ranitomeya imitator]|uniref:G-protein coupled receptors family 1 profile domain-containing protein n=1 Tax=Ranitomeya imitator TaxID=111125 RepID=A0ABN9L7L2_9NEOB|nr:unnamed protein product [Ranitomeya imitator]